MAATGNIIFASSSTYQVDANASGAGDRLTTSGNIVIQGGAVAALAQPGDFALSTRYTILTAGGSLSGTFAGVSANLAFLTPSLTYDAQNAYLSLVRNDIRFPTVAGTFNQRAAAGGSEPLGAGNRVFDALVRLTAAQAPAAFDSLSGEIHASARGALLDDSRFVRDAMLERREAGRGAWASGYGSWGEIESDGNAAALDRDSAGLFAGVNLPLGSSWSAGIAGGYSRASFDGEARASEAQAESWHAAARLMGSFGALRIAAGGAVSFHSIDTARSIVIPGFSDNATARYDGRTLQGFAEASYEIPLGQATIEPFASLAWAEIETEQFQEAGGAAALSGEEASDSTAYSTLGLRTSASLGALSLTGSVGWQHDFESDPSSSNLRFVTGPGTRFTVAGAPTSEDALLVQAGAEFKLGGGAGIGLIYTGQFGDRSDSQGARATLSVPF
jgi:outer membrane autotransporter protein